MVRLKPEPVQLSDEIAEWELEIKKKLYNTIRYEIQTFSLAGPFFTDLGGRGLENFGQQQKF